MRWQLRLMEFSFVAHHKPGKSTVTVVPDALSRSSPGMEENVLPDSAIEALYMIYCVPKKNSKQFNHLSEYLKGNGSLSENEVQILNTTKDKIKKKNKQTS
jgi:hypothetical protein